MWVCRNCNKTNEGATNLIIKDDTTKMKGSGLKIKLIYARWLIILFAFVVIYSFLHWLLFIRLQVYDIHERVVIWILPLVLPLVPVLIWLRKRMRLLNMQSSKGDRWFESLVLASLFIGGVTVAFQYLLVSATGELRTLKTPEEIALYRRAKYYVIDQYHADKSRARLQRFSYTSGKSNHTLNYETIIAVPLYNQPGDTSRSNLFIIDEGIVAPPMETGLEAPVKIKTVNDTIEAPVAAA